MKYYKYLNVLLFTLLLFSHTYAFSQESDACIPNCRPGFMCYDAQCISKCNPACGEQEQCTDEGLCIAKERSSTKRKTKIKKKAKSVLFSASLGTVLEGDVYVGGYEIDADVTTEQGFILRTMVDRSVSPLLSVGLYLNYISVGLGLGGDVSITTPGITIKAPIKITDEVDLRLGIAFGYQMTSAVVGGYVVDDIQGFDVAPIAEFSTQLNEDMNVLFSISAFSQPTGGNNDYTVEWAPIVFLAGGLEFGG